MKNKKYLLISCIALFAVLMSACAGAVSADTSVDAGGVQVQSAPAVLNTDSTNQIAANAPAQQQQQGNRPGGPDLTAVAAALGVTVDELQQALQNAIPADCAPASNTNGQNAQPAQGTNCRPDLAAVATALGVTEDELKAALGSSMQGGRQGGGDLTAVAEALGVTVEELQQALQNARPADCTTTDPNTQPAQGTDCRPDLAAVATALGVTEEELQTALKDRKGGPDFAAAAETLGVTEEALQQALQDTIPAECATGQNTQPAQGVNCRPDLDAAATTLGITVDQLQSALGTPPQDGQGGHGGPMNGQPQQGGGQQPPQGGAQPPAPQP